MNFKISFGTKFKRDFKTIKRRGYPFKNFFGRVTWIVHDPIHNHGFSHLPKG